MAKGGEEWVAIHLLPHLRVGGEFPPFFQENEERRSQVNIECSPFFPQRNANIGTSGG